jgi:nicotinate phosphoribosyltransferase
MNFNPAYTDCYFTKSKQALMAADHNPSVVYQIFQKHDALLCGMKQLVELHSDCSDAVRIFGLQDGMAIKPFEAVAHIIGPVQELVERESVYLGYLARLTRIATNVRAAVDAANGKPVLFFPARFDAAENQQYDGYAAKIGGATGCATLAQTLGFGNDEPVGTMPHALIAAFKGDTVAAMRAFAKARPDEGIVALVDFHNDIVKTTLECIAAADAEGIKLVGVRLDTSEKLVDKSLSDRPEHKGVNVCLVEKLLLALHENHKDDHIKIVVSGGFTPEKIATFEKHFNGNGPHVYAIGEGFLKGSNAFTSDIVAHVGFEGLESCGKVGRTMKMNGDFVNLRETYESGQDSTPSKSHQVAG